MKKNLILDDCNAERAEMLREELVKVRCWITGFEAAGKSPPPGVDALRQLDVILKHSVSKAREK